MTDRLTLARALEKGGIARDAAEHIATEIFDAIHDNVATKADLQRVEAALKADVAAVRAEIGAVRGELALVEHRLMTRLGGMIAAATGILIAIHYFH
jgi:hypothetical protein